MVRPTFRPTRHGNGDLGSVMASPVSTTEPTSAAPPATTSRASRSRFLLQHGAGLLHRRVEVARLAVCSLVSVLDQPPAHALPSFAGGHVLHHACQASRRARLMLFAAVAEHFGTPSSSSSARAAKYLHSLGWPSSQGQKD